jgi:hypothetical protein
MKKLTAALILTTVLGLLTQAQLAKADTLALQGVEMSRGMRGVLDLSGRVSGSLPGAFQISLRYDPSTGRVLGGTWKLTVAQRAQGGARKVEGALYGTISGGTVGVNKRGRVESLKGLQMSVRRGTGRHAAVSLGSGEADGTINPRRQHRFQGTLRLQL